MSNRPERRGANKKLQLTEKSIKPVARFRWAGNPSVSEDVEFEHLAAEPTVYFQPKTFGTPKGVTVSSKKKREGNETKTQDAKLSKV